jgi:hypothetical protein
MTSRYFRKICSLFPISWSHCNCTQFWYPLYVLDAQSTKSTNVRNKLVNTQYWTYTTGVEFKAFRIITLFISGVNWWRSTTCQRTASRVWHTATLRIMYKKVVSDKLCVRNINQVYHDYNICVIIRTLVAHSHTTYKTQTLNYEPPPFHRGPGYR